MGLRVGLYRLGEYSSYYAATLTQSSALLLHGDKLAVPPCVSSVTRVKSSSAPLCLRRRMQDSTFGYNESA